MALLLNPLMHYMNGRPVKVGDWVVGRTHNSRGQCRVGIVQETMEKQGPCNVRLHVWLDQHFHDDGCPDHHVPATESRGEDDYADAKSLIKAEDGYRMVDAIEDHGKWDGPYL